MEIVAETLREVQENSHFITTLNSRGKDELQQLKALLDGIILSNGEDEVKWKWDGSKDFKVQHCYSFFMRGGVVSHFGKFNWKLPNSRESQNF